ncbi:unnamed protein product, partial [Linum tenue]
MSELRFGSSTRPDDSIFTATLACGTIAGLAASAVTFPLEVVQRRMQMEDIKGLDRAGGGGFRRMFWQIVEKEGVRGLYRAGGGFKPHCLMTGLGHAVGYMAYEIAKQPIVMCSSTVFNPLLTSWAGR